MQRKKLTGADVHLSSITWQAKQFLVAALRCLPPGLPNGVWEGPVGPGVVCASFSVELWLKALHCAAAPAVQAPSGHDLVKLFGLLAPNVQEQLAFGCSYSPSEFENSLSLNARVFETWRYSYEHGAGSDEPIHALEADVRLLLELAGSCEAVYERLYPPTSSQTAPPVDNAGG